MSVEQRIPLTIIGGYLGSGKTTLLNELLQASHRLRLAVLMNDFGSINIDAELIRHHSGETISLTNGCICCSISDDLGVALMSLVQRAAPPEYIVIEASGVADPNKLARYGRLPRFRLGGVIVVADAETVRQRARDKYVGETVVRQLRSADLIVLNKVDLVTDERRAELRAWVASVSTDARVVEAVRGRVPAAVLIDLPGPEARAAARAGSDSSPVHHHDLDYETQSYESTTPLVRAAFETWVRALPTGVLRGKGVLHLSDVPDRRTIFQLVGRRWEFEVGELWGDTVPSSQLVVIGLPGSLAGIEIERALG